MKAACLLIDSTYILTVSNSGGKGKDILGSGFTGRGEGARGDGIVGAGSVGRSDVSKIVVGTGAGVGISSGWVLLASFVFASDPESCLSLDSVDS